MAFKKIETQKKYWDFNTTPSGTKIVNEGTYLGASQGKFGLNHDFKEKDGTIVCIAGGQLNYIIDTHVATGDVCNVFYKGKSVLTKGIMAGKEAKNFEIEIEEKTEPQGAAKLKPKVEAKPIADDDITL